MIMSEVEMLISGFFTKDGRKMMRVSFMRGKDFAEGLLPDGIIDRSEGFSEEEIGKLEKFIRANSQEIMAQGREINPIRSWLKDK